MDDAQLPQTATVFDQPALDFDAHTWIQVGTMLEHRCTNSCYLPAQGIPIPPGKMLTKQAGKYTLIDE